MAVEASAALQPFKPADVKREFPIFEREVNGRPIV